MSLGPADQKVPTTLKQRLFSLPSLLSFAVALVFIYFLATRFDLDWHETWGNVRAMDPRLYVLALVLYYVSFGFRGLRWQLLARNAGIDDSGGAKLPSALTLSQLIIIGWFVNGVAWLRLGDAYRAYAFAERSGGHFSWSLGTVLAERVVDMATVLVLIVAGVALFSLTRDSSGTGFILAAAVLMVSALIVVLAMMKGYGARLARFLPQRLEAAYHQFHQGTLGSFRQLPAVFFLGLVAWVLEVARLYFVVQALGLTIDVPHVIIVALGHAILSTVPTPGGVGAVEPGVTGLLVLGMAREEAASVTLVDRSITYLSILVIGGLAFVLWQASQARKIRSQPRVAEGIPGGEAAADG